MLRPIYKFFDPQRYFHLVLVVRGLDGLPTTQHFWFQTRSALTAGADSSGANHVGSKFEQHSVTREQQLTSTLKRSMPGITYISVQDISGGCGAMYEISVEAKEFIGLSRVKQHRLVTDSLKSEIAEMHGIRIHTTPPVEEK